MNIDVLIVDDEPLARQRLRRLLATFDDVNIVAEAKNGQQAIDLNEQMRPNLVFMDIQMPGVNGLKAAEEIANRCRNNGEIKPPSIIFCTAFDSFAIKAFELNASDYLLKPVSKDSLHSALERARQVNQLQASAISSVYSADNLVSSITIVRNEVIHKVAISDIAYFRSEDKHVFAGLHDGVETFVDYTLKEIEMEFSNEFQRVHRSAIVNKHQSVSLIKNKEGASVLELSPSGQRFMVSRRLLPSVKKCFF